MILKELQGKELLEAKEKELRRALKQYRIDVGLSSPFQVSKELGMGKDTVYKYEKGTSIPTFDTNDVERTESWEDMKRRMENSKDVSW